ncbi:hypothetical protein BTVI_00821 [Pitangus sulphuratus]|nr:hypothetical protein BTVI_00821 [Pitangus sulphuratus]
MELSMFEPHHGSNYGLDGAGAGAGEGEQQQPVTGEVMDHLGAAEQGMEYGNCVCVCVCVCVCGGADRTRHHPNRKPPERGHGVEQGDAGMWQSQAMVAQVVKEKGRVTHPTKEIAAFSTEKPRRI